MSPGVPSRVAELGGDPHRLAEAFHRLLVRAEKIVERDSSSVASLAAAMQAIAIQTLASNVGRLVDAIEADNERASSLPLPPAPRCPSCDHPRGFGVACNLARRPDPTQQGRCGCSHSFHAGGAQ